MFLSDTHTHSRFSFDGSDTAAAMEKSAKDHGLSALALTEHCDFYHFGRCPHYARKEEDCQQEMFRLKQGEKDLLFLYGVELGQPHHNPGEARALLQRHPYDMVIGSVHTLADGRDIYYTPYPDKDACREVLDIYFEDLENLLKFGDFDTLGHLDYPLRVMEGPWEEPTLAEYKERVAPILQKLAQMGKALEINAKGCREWFHRPGPEEWILRQFREYGGTMITMGSDAHSVENVGNGIPQACALAQKAGFEKVTVFQNRKPRQFDIV